MIDLKKIQKNLKEQDNRITSDPLFVVFQERRVSADSNFSESYWFVLDSETKCEDHKKLREWLRDNYEGEDKAFKLDIMSSLSFPDNIIEELAEREGFEKYYYQDIDIFVTACFTEEGAKDYLRQNQHNLTQPYIYVTSLYRNDEMIGIRELLMNNSGPFKLKRHTLGGKKGFDTTYPLPDLTKFKQEVKHENRTI